MSLLRLSIVVILLLGGTTAAVVSYVESRRPVQVPTVVDHQLRVDPEPPGFPTPPVAVEESSEPTTA